MSSIADSLNDDLAEHLPAAAACLSALGRRCYFPPGIPFQTAEARDARYTATIGQVTNGHGQPLPLPALAEALGRLDARQAHLYSPPQGHEALRDAWGARQRRLSGGSTAPASRPVMVHGLTQGLAFAADLFLDEGSPCLIPHPCWGNYRQVFGIRKGARLVPFDLFEDHQYSVEPLRRALAATDEPAMLVLNFPHNPSGYTLTRAQVDELVRVVAAHPGPLAVVVDDAYHKMVWKEGLLDRSLAWDLAEAADPERHVIVKVDGVTKELLFFPGRVGFITFMTDPDGPAAAALESKCKSLARSANGSPVGPSQAAVLHALAQDDLEAQLDAARSVLARRFRALEAILDDLDEPGLVPYPANSGVFALVGVDGVDAHDLRRRLIADHDVGLISIGSPNAVRVAYCSCAEEDIPALMDGLVAGIRAARAAG